MWLYIWLFVTAFALIFEFVTTDMLSIWFAGGGLVALVLSAVGLEWYIQLPVFFAVSLVLLLVFRRLVLKKLNSEEVRTNADMAIGKEFRLLSAITFDNVGSIKVNDVVWNAVSFNDMPIPAGTIVIVRELKGNKYIVEPLKEEI
ncbi:MAG: NfeD family protein [Clostridia bacterium]|nr:NfeD family protein [Clostridia bacterium]